VPDALDTRAAALAQDSTAAREALSPATQRYLMAVFAAQRDAPVTTTLVARELDLSLPTASEMLRRLGDAGLLARAGVKSGWQLTARGQRHVAILRRRQAVLERFLQTVLGMDATEAAQDAARLGPAVSLNLENRLRDTVWPAERPCRSVEA
jgi:Mn-dependent DtxR family transcriptional regulator